MGILINLFNKIFKIKTIEFNNDLINLCQTYNIPDILKLHCKEIVNQLNINSIYYPLISLDENNSICLIWMSDEIYCELLITLSGLQYYFKVNNEQILSDKELDYNISNIPKKFIDIIKLKNQKQYNIYPVYRLDY
jgi:hypothetical protein